MESSLKALYKPVDGNVRAAAKVGKIIEFIK